MQFDIVVAVDNRGGIGKNNLIPWRLPDDLRYFRKLTTTASDGKINAVIMGRKTWDSLPDKWRPLKNRLNIVLSRSTLSLPAGVESARSLAEAMEIAAAHHVERCFVIGGAQIYEEALAHPELQVVHLTRLEADFDCDVFFPGQPPLYLVESSAPKEEEGIRFVFEKLRASKGPGP